MSDLPVDGPAKPANVAGSTAPSISVTVDDRDDQDPASAERYASLLASCLRDQGVSGPADVGLAFVGVDEMAVLNHEHMGGHGPTDVLAFPIDGASPAPVGQPAIVGDIVVCPAVAAKAAQPLDDELALLVVHGALHLLGHDHAEPAETEVMQRLERQLLAAHWPSQ